MQSNYLTSIALSLIRTKQAEKHNFFYILHSSVSDLESMIAPFTGLRGALSPPPTVNAPADKARIKKILNTLEFLYI